MCQICIFQLSLYTSWHIFNPSLSLWCSRILIPHSSTLSNAVGSSHPHSFWCSEIFTHLVTKNTIYIFTTNKYLFRIFTFLLLHTLVFIPFMIFIDVLHQELHSVDGPIWISVGINIIQPAIWSRNSERFFSIIRFNNHYICFTDHQLLLLYCKFSQVYLNTHRSL